jgi:uncharacterized protein (DUF433 family)
MNLNQILEISESVGINDQRFIGQMLSRNQRITTSEILTVVPFQFTLAPMKYLYYSQNRDLLANLRFYDKALTQYLNFGTTNWVSYIAYQGSMTSTQISACQWQTSSLNKELVLGNLPSIASTSLIVKAGDFCQVGLYSYIATENVTRGLGSTVTIPVHRNLIQSVTSPINAVIGQYGTTVSMGGNTYTGVTFQVILKEYPTYTLVPIASDAFISWAGNFVAFEAVLP